MDPDGTELRSTSDGRGRGVYATRAFRAGEIVVLGVIERRVAANSAHAVQIGPSSFALLAGTGSMVNHSCDPNCGVRVNASGAPDLVARRAIAAGEEVTFDYAMGNYVVEHFPDRCRCGSAGCRGAVTGWKDLSPEVRRRYHDLVAPFLLEIDGQVV